ncbi:glutathione S-transferase family protein [Ascidiaceihabitans sp.]|uniref:glutathione S-transferase family protein n=1 Tax=Ascidiaceihabitans sp. TaxID=1872644 RepID=UPI003296D8C4
MSYILHYAPDNASLIIRMALERLGVDYDTVLVDRSTATQRSVAYLKINPNGLIPTLETPQGPIFETGAILLWLTDTHGTIGPAPGDPARGAFLKWLFYLSNTVHPALRMTFYPEKYIEGAAGQSALRLGLQKALVAQFQTLNTVADTPHNWLGQDTPGALDYYVAALLRWPAVYPNDTDRSWFRLADYPNLNALCAHLEKQPEVRNLEDTEGLGSQPFTAPRPTTPKHGSAL